jgi:hypothetical protein
LHSVPPENKEQRSALRRWNKYQYGYGGNKLGCDEELVRAVCETVSQND